MININISEVKSKLSRYLERVAGGETVVICKRNVPIAELRPLAAVPKKSVPSVWLARSIPISDSVAHFSNRYPTI